jgi:hypothetical protein
MNTIRDNRSKLREMMHEAGFLPDGDLLEFGELVIEECVKALGPKNSSITFAESAEWERNIQKIKDHFISC